MLDHTVFKPTEHDIAARVSRAPIGSSVATTHRRATLGIAAQKPMTDQGLASPAARTCPELDLMQHAREFARVFQKARRCER